MIHFVAVDLPSAVVGLQDKLRWWPVAVGWASWSRSASTNRWDAMTLHLPASVSCVFTVWVDLCCREVNGVLLNPSVSVHLFGIGWWSQSNMALNLNSSYCSELYTFYNSLPRFALYICSTAITYLIFFYRLWLSWVRLDVNRGFKMNNLGINAQFYVILLLNIILIGFSRHW